MGKNILIIVLLLGTVQVNAQGWRFSIFADPQLSWFTSDSRRFEPGQSLGAINVGISAEKYFAERYAMQYGVSISNLGGNIEYVDAGNTLITRDSSYSIAAGSSIKYRGQYLSVPLGLKFKTIEIGYTSIYAHAGVTANALLKGYVWEPQNGVEKEVVSREQVWFGYVTYFIGAGIQYSLGGPSALQLGLIFNNGLTPVYKGGHGKISMGNLGIRVGIVF